MAKVRIELNRTAVRQLLRSPEVRADLEARARRIAAAAGPGHEVHEAVGPNRVRVEVVTETVEAQVAEATDRDLSRALDAGRG